MKLLLLISLIILCACAVPHHSPLQAPPVTIAPKLHPPTVSLMPTITPEAP